MSDRGWMMDRRAALTGAAVASGALAAPGVLAASGVRRFPRGFKWGASTASYQVEGNCVNTDLWLMEHVEPRTFVELSGDSNDSYHRWREDIALMKAIGLNAYRFSIEWSRIEPNQGQFSQAAIDYYKRFIAALHEAGIEPVMTFFHVSAPRWFGANGGWLAKDSADLFGNYCDKVARQLAGSIGVACTINEPQVGLTYRVIPQARAYFGKRDGQQLQAHAAAAKATGGDRFVTLNHPDIVGMTPNLMAGHEKAYAAIKAARSDLPTGVTLNLVDFQPANEGSKYRELRKLAYGSWMEVAGRSGDFVGVQTYRQVRIPGEGAKLSGYPELPFVTAGDEQEIIKQPSALRNMVEYAYEASGKPILVTENGIETSNDKRREWYIPQVLVELHEAMAKGVPVMGYMHWSLMDNFEWLQGYKPEFGLASVDRTTLTRKLKPSAAVYRKIIRANSV